MPELAADFNRRDRPGAVIAGGSEATGASVA